MKYKTYTKTFIYADGAEKTVKSSSLEDVMETYTDEYGKSLYPDSPLVSVKTVTTQELSFQEESITTKTAPVIEQPVEEPIVEEPI